MPAAGTDAAPHHRLRFIFDKVVLSFSLAVGSTLEDVGRTMQELVLTQYGQPIAIDVTLTSRRVNGPTTSLAGLR